jgi:hypothetical protein
LQTDVGQYAEAEQSAQTSIEVNEALLHEVPSSSYYQMWAGRAYGSLGKAQLKAGSRGTALANLRKSAAILETSDEANILYNRACSLALASTLTDPAEGQTASDRQRRDADQAVATMRRAIKVGLANFDVWRNDPDFDSLRSRPDFQALLMDLAYPADPFAREGSR